MQKFALLLLAFFLLPSFSAVAACTEGAVSTNQICKNGNWELIKCTQDSNCPATYKCDYPHSNICILKPTTPTTPASPTAPTVNSPTTPTNPTTMNASGFPNPLKAASLSELLTVILHAIVQIGSILLVLALVYVGFLFVAAQGAEEKIRDARGALVWTVVGGLLLLGAETIAKVVEATVKAL